LSLTTNEESMVYWVSEIFTSIQGEGGVIGTPSNFIRLAGCNLRCLWCDTKYSWVREQGSKTKISEIIGALDRRIKITTITGGEPLLQDVTPLVRALKTLGHRVIVETSGTIKPKPELRKLVDVFSVSPKLSNSGFTPKYSFREDDWATYYKFVIVKPKEDLNEVEEFVRSQRIPDHKVILQPDGNREDYINALSEIVEEIMRRGLTYRVLPQLHRILGVR
jgi:7-carboxy-7-deazaguanine synthase